MNHLTELFCGRPPTGCADGPPDTMPVGRNGSAVCHRHTPIPQGHILFWTALAVLGGFLLEIFLSWATLTWSADAPNRWVYLARQLEKFHSDTGYFVYVFAGLLVVLWSLATLIVCRRKFVSLTDYIIFAVAVPVAGLSSFSNFIMQSIAG